MKLNMWVLEIGGYKIQINNQKNDQAQYKKYNKKYNKKITKNISIKVYNFINILVYIKINSCDPYTEKKALKKQN